MKLSNKYIFLVVEILVKDWIDYLFFAFHEKIPIEVDGFFKQQVAMSTIQSNDIEHDSYLFFEKPVGCFFAKLYQIYMWQFQQDLFFSWGKNLHELDFLKKFLLDSIKFYIDRQQ